MDSAIGERIQNKLLQQWGHVRRNRSHRSLVNHSAVYFLSNRVVLWFCNDQELHSNQLFTEQRVRLLLWIDDTKPSDFEHWHHDDSVGVWLFSDRCRLVCNMEFFASDCRRYYLLNLISHHEESLICIYTQDAFYIVVAWLFIEPTTVQNGAEYSVLYQRIRNHLLSDIKGWFSITLSVDFNSGLDIFVFYNDSDNRKINH